VIGEEENARLSFSAIQRAWERHPLRIAVVPLERWISLPMPTMHYGRPAYVFFSASNPSPLAERKRIGPPDRWWVLAADHAEPMLFALCSVLPLGGREWSPTPLGEDSERTLEQIEVGYAQLQRAMDVVSVAFLSGGEASESSKCEVLTQLRSQLPESILEQHRAAAPDFFRWLCGITCA